MRIISKFKDYYDGVSGTFYDSSIVYVREQKIVDVDNSIKNSVESFVKWSTDYEIRVLLFCGKYYLIYTLEWNDKWNGFHKMFYGDYKFNCYNLKSLREKRSSLDDRYFDYDNTGRFDVTFNLSNKVKLEYHPYFHQYSVDKFLEKTPPIDIFQKYNTPSILIYQSDKGLKMVINPVLKELEFYKIFDAYQCHQQLSMFLGGVLTKPPEPESISDELNRDRHGFDDMSFKREKTKNKNVKKGE